MTYIQRKLNLKTFYTIRERVMQIYVEYNNPFH